VADPRSSRDVHFGTPTGGAFSALCGPSITSANATLSTQLLPAQSDKMRPGQQNNNGSNNNNNKNRQRGRNNNNGGRKHLNPLSRNYESNGPDVKVRGNAAHITEKYVQLARDAHASGDSVMAENYLQHAEHYFRIVAAAQPQGMQRTDQFGQDYDGNEQDGDDGDGQGEGMEQTRFDDPQFRTNVNQNNDRQNQNGDRQNNDRQNNDRQNNQNNRDDRQPRDDRPQRDDRQPRFEQPVRAETVAPTVVIEAQEVAEAPVQATEETEGEPRRVRERRPRRRRPSAAEGAAVDPAGPQPDVGELPAFITAGGTTNAAE